MARLTIRSGNLFFRSLSYSLIFALAAAPMGVAQESVWSAYNDAGTKMFDDKEYARAEKLLVDAVKEAERLPADGQKLLKSLRVLRKVYLALGKGAQVSQVESRMRSLGEVVNTAGGASMPTEDPASDPTLSQSFRENVSPESKGMKRESDEGTGSGADKVREKEFTISTSSSAPVETAEEEPPTRRSIASTGGIPELLGGSKKAQEALQLVGHSGWTKALDVSPDGNRALSGSQDNTIRYWNLKTGKEISHLEGHDDDVNAVIFSTAGNTAVSGGSDKTVRLWDLDLGTELKKFEGHQNLVTCVAISESGSRIASGGYDGTVRVWDANTGKVIKVLEGNLGTVRAVAFTPDGEQVVSGGTDKAVTLWNIRDGKAARKFQGHKNEISSLAVSKDGTKILSSSRDQTIQLWDLISGEPLKLLQGHGNWIQKAEFLSDDKVISGGLDKTIRIWDLNSAKEIESYKLQPFGMWSVAFTKKGDYCLTGSDDFSIRVWLLP